MIYQKYDGTKYLAFFYSNEEYDRIFDRIRYLITLKNNITDVHFHKYMKIEINSDDNLPFRKD